VSDHASTRRIRFAVLTAVLLTAVTASAVVLLSITSRYNTRFDVTATREHALSARTKEILTTMTGTHRIVLSVDSTRLDPRSRLRITDVLDEFQQASDLIELVEIDTSTPASLPAFTKLITELAANESAEIQEQKRILNTAAASTDSLVERIREFDGLLKTARNAYEPTDERSVQLTRLAQLFSTELPKLTEAAKGVREDAETMFTGVSIPDARSASARLVPALYNAATLAETAARYAGILEQSETRDAIIGPLREIVRTAEPLRDDALLTSDALSTLKALRVLDIARALRSNDAVLVINPKRTTAIDFRSLFPPTTLIDSNSASGAEITFAGEELLASAIASINNPRNPVLVFVHGETERMFDEAGKPLPNTRRFYGNLLSRLRLRGFGLVEWHTASQEFKPSHTELDPTGNRPIVYFVSGPPSVSGNRDSAGMRQADRAIRLGTLTMAVHKLVDDGESIIFSYGLSDLAALGERDPLAEPLASLGVRVRTDLMLLNVPTNMSGKRVAYNEFRLPRSEGEHPIAQAIDGLAIAFPTPIAIEIDQTDGVEVSPLLALRDTEAIYAESEWTRLPYPISPQPLRINVLPTLSPTRDMAEPISPIDGAWVLAAAITENASGRRLVVIGSQLWFADIMSQRQMAVEGRNIWVNPGNLELLEASVYWLAGLDEMIAPSPHTLDIPRIKPLDHSQITLIRWLLIVIVPSIPLLIGAAWRLLRP